MRWTYLLAVCGLILMAGPSARADWQPGDGHKMHYPQLPDLQTGLNVLATYPKVLADDWQCTETGDITDIHIWGSWLNDVLPQVEAPGQPGTFVGDPGAVRIRLSQWTNVPDDPNDPDDFSHPGEEIWAWWFDPGEFVVAQPPQSATEQFYNPNTGDLLGPDTLVWQYNFFLDEVVPSTVIPHQEEGEIYWLDVVVQPLDETGTAQPLFGWKTTLPELRFMDDAVYADFTENVEGDPVPPESDDWLPMFYPDGHPNEFETLDLAFVITPEPATLALLGFGSAGLLASRRRRRERSSATEEVAG